MIGKNERLSIRHAAKAIGRSREYVRHLIETRKVTAYRIGGTAKNPWLEVDMAELRKAVDSDSIYIPPATRVRKRQYRGAVELDPVVANW